MKPRVGSLFAVAGAAVVCLSTISVTEAKKRKVVLEDDYDDYMYEDDPPIRRQGGSHGGGGGGGKADGSLCSSNLIKISTKTIFFK